MTKPLTKRQYEVLQTIERLMDKGYSPSYSEVGEACGLKSLATVHKHISNLQKKGYLTKAFNCGRSLQQTSRIRKVFAGDVAAKVVEEIFDDVNGPLIEMQELAFDHMLDVVSLRRDRLVGIVKSALEKVT